MKFSIPALIVCAAFGGSIVLAAEPSRKVDFNRDIRPILADACFNCHGPDAKQRKAELRLDNRAGLFAKRDGQAIVAAGNLSKSELIARIKSTDNDLRMPPADSRKSLTKPQIELIERWVREGAEWKGHWSYVKPVRPQPPTVPASTFVRNAIDRFVARGHRASGIAASKPADRRILIRRLKFDLLGLPPTPEEVDAFVNDKDPKAYEKLIDRFLKSPHYGERLALVWLDLVRYADTNGIHGDNHRDVAPYRDYVIDAFNRNQPFDQFTVEQIAGDLLPKPTVDQKVASGYNRMLMTTREGGAQAKEYLAKYAADRVRNVSGVWLGSTMGCCECHDHKYDPFTMKDFYSLASYFADVKEVAVGQQPSNLRVPSKELQSQLAELDIRIAGAKLRLEEAANNLGNEQAVWEKTTRQKLAAGEFAWNALTPSSAKSSGRSTLKIQKDASVLSTGRNPAKDSYTVAFKLNAKSITGIRLEALTHKSLAGGGLSRSNGNFVLTELEVLAKSPGQKTPERVKIAKAVADFSQDGFPVSAAIDGKPNTGWAVSGHERKGQSRQAVFTFEKPIAGGPGTVLTVRLRHQSQYKQHNIGRFRIAATGATSPALGEGSLPANIVAILKTDSVKQTAKQKQALADYYRSVAPELAPIRKEIQQSEQRKRALQAAAPATLITESVKPRMMRILPRGNWLDDTGPVVQPAVPGFLKKPAGSGKRQTRMDLAQWVVSRDNPLTARVFVNRLWKQMYGRGIVSSLDDFGSQGAWPTHPELLDWLAIEFIESGWNVKHMLKLMALSGTYQQSSYASPADLKRDPFNKWLGRQGRFRLDAEMVRDNALAVSGILVEKIGGKSVKPYQPSGYWSHLNFPRRVYKADTGESQYRRGLYTYWCRTFLHPSLLAFDASTREECTVERPRSNTPLQALVLLNDPTYVEAARALAERVLHSGGKTDASRIRRLYRIVLTREPLPAESAILSRLVDTHRAQYKADPKSAADFNATGQRPPAKDIAPAELAAWTSVTRVVLNLHETITRF